MSVSTGWYALVGAEWVTSVGAKCTTSMEQGG